MRQPAAARTATRRGGKAHRGGKARRALVVGGGAAVAAIIGAFALQPSASTPLVGDHGGTTITEDDGVVPDGVTPFDDAHPGVVNLDPHLLHALRQAAGNAAGDGITLYVNSGWRSPAYQEQLLREAVAEHGSAAEAARWAATPDTSAHVSGDAVDIGPFDAMAWLAEHGAEHGLCQTYGNEPWHYELRPEATGRGCPPSYPDPTHDPRMQKP